LRAFIHLQVETFFKSPKKILSLKAIDE